MSVEDKNTENASLTPAEWNVMECLWEEAPRTVMQMVAALKTKAGWAKSTSTTMISRMEKKGLIHCNENEKPKYYYPMIQRENAVAQETRSFLDRVYRGSVGMLLNNAVQHQELSQEEINQLYAILQKAEGEKKC